MTVNDNSPSVQEDPALSCEHDWRKQPTGMHTLDHDGSLLYLLRCAICKTKAWGPEHSDYTEWPRWSGRVVRVEVPLHRPEEFVVTT